MAQGDFGVVPNVWRPQFVPPINSGEDTQVGMTGNAAANIGATTTTVEESFFNVPVVGWQKIKDGPSLSVVTAVTYTTIADFKFFTNTSRTLIIIQYRGGTGLAALSFRFSAASPYQGTFGAVTVGSGNNQVGFYSVLLSPMANLTYVTATPRTDGLTNVYATGSYDAGAIADLTANLFQGIGQATFNLIPVSDGPGTDPSFATVLSGDIDTFVPINVESKVGAGSAQITRFEVWKLGNRLAALTSAV